MITKNTTASEGNCKKIQASAASFTISMEVRSFLSLPSTSYVEFISSKFSYETHYSNFACLLCGYKKCIPEEMHQSIKLVKTSRKDTLENSFLLWS